MRQSRQEVAARDALRAKQGGGARYDADGAPHDSLLLARRGTAFFARKLNELRNDELNANSARPGWSRRHLIAHVSYQARATTRLLEWARTGKPQRMYSSIEARDKEIELGATLPAQALRNLFQHTAAHLNVEWRDLPENAWQARLETLEGIDIAASDTPLIRAREVWLGAKDLANGASEADVPREVFNIDKTMLSD